jgi:hypothetical protein
MELLKENRVRSFVLSTIQYPKCEKPKDPTSEENQTIQHPKKRPFLIFTTH